VEILRLRKYPLYTMALEAGPEVLDHVSTRSRSRAEPNPTSGKLSRGMSISAHHDDAGGRAGQGAPADIKRTYGRSRSLPLNQQYFYRRPRGSCSGQIAASRGLSSVELLIVAAEAVQARV
jgi:hypothetical protein